MQGNVNDKYIFEKELGKGTYGSVYQAISKQTDKVRAIK